MDVFEEAHDDNVVVARFIPGRATRRVLSPTARAAAVPVQDAPTGAVTPPTS